MVVKVQRPEAARQIRKDIELLMQFAELARGADRPRLLPDGARAGVRPLDQTGSWTTYWKLATPSASPSTSSTTRM